MFGGVRLHYPDPRTELATRDGRQISSAGCSGLFHVTWRGRRNFKKLEPCFMLQPMSEHWSSHWNLAGPRQKITRITGLEIAGDVK